MSKSATDTIQHLNTQWAGSLNPAIMRGEFMENTTTEALMNEWIFFYLLFLLVAYLVARIFLGTLFSSTVAAAFRYSNAVSMFNDNSLLQRQRDNVLYSFYFLSIGLFIMKLTEFFNVEILSLNPLQLSLTASLFLAVIFGFRILVGRMIGHIFYARKLFAEYLYHGFEYNKLMGIVMLPMLLLMAFTSPGVMKYLLFGSIMLLIIVLMAKIWRLLLFSLRNRVLNIYLFFYLCALEIVPYLLLYKWFDDYLLQG